MNWSEFKNQLMQHPDLHLQFQYGENQFVHPSFHITEIKQNAITSVDCGGKMNAWTEIILQLWEPSQKESPRSMTAAKALQIIDVVEKSLPLNPKAIVKIEFGNDTFDTRQMHPQYFQFFDDEVIVNLIADKTQCKAIDRGETCGSPKLKVKLAEVTAGCCTPESGCC